MGIEDPRSPDTGHNARRRTDNRTVWAGIATAVGMALAERI